MIVSVTRAPLRLLVMALVGLPMILLSIDMTLTHRFFPEPDTTPVVVGTTIDETTNSEVDVTKDVLTRDGEAQRRREVAWGIALFIGGAALLAWAARELAVPRRLLVASEEGIALAVTERRRLPMLVPWDEVHDVRSGVIADDAGDVSVLSIQVTDPGRFPERPHGARVEGDTIHVFADEWDHSVQEVAATLALRITRSL